MKAILILAGPYSSCDATKNTWQDICAKNNIEFETYDLSNAKGKEIAKNFNMKSYPALIVNDAVVAVGHPNQETAEKIIQDLKK